MSSYVVASPFPQEWGMRRGAKKRVLCGALHGPRRSTSNRLRSKDSALLVPARTAYSNKSWLLKCMCKPSCVSALLCVSWHAHAEEEI